MSKVQTDNSFLQDKIILRLKHLPKKDVINILDCFSGDSKIWDEIKKNSDKEINVLKIEQKEKSGIYLKGDNIKFLISIDLKKFDVIDLDAYGIPYKQLNVILKKANKDTVVYVTFIQSLFGVLPIKFLVSLGYSKKMIKKIPTLFFKNGFEKLKLYLANNGVKKIYSRSHANKHYLAFKIS